MLKTAGFILAGGRSTRMGSDKAALEIGGLTLLEQVARHAAAAAGPVTIIGPADRYGGAGWPVIADRRSGRGPLAGIETALELRAAEWNLIVAVDMPGLRAEFLARILGAAIESQADCLLPVSPSGYPEPLCAVYHSRCLAAVSAALDRDQNKITAALEGLQVLHFPIHNQESVTNVNTPEDWARYRG